MLPPKPTVATLVRPWACEFFRAELFSGYAVLTTVQGPHLTRALQQVHEVQPKEQQLVSRDLLSAVDVDAHSTPRLNRDRFILSNGHGCMLQYALLHLFGYKISMDDLKAFRVCPK